MKHSSGPRISLLFAAGLTALLVAAKSWATSPRAAGAVSVLFADAGRTDGQVAYWQFDERTGISTADFAAIGFTATLTNGATFSPTVPSAITRFDPSSLFLDGVNDRVDIDDNTAPDLASSFSLAAWIRRTTTGSYDAIYDSGTNANKWWVFIADGSVGKDNKVGLGKRGIAEFYSSAAIVDTAWHHVAVVVNGTVGTNLTFYVDGSQSGQAAAGALSVPSGGKRIGALLDGALSSFYAGNIDELRLFNRPLGPAEIARLASGRGCASDGRSWAAAFGDLQCALDEAVSGDEIWAARGSYRPGSVISATFELKDDVDLFGGFLGTESARDQRPAFIQPSTVVTRSATYSILSGDLLDNDSITDFSRHGDNSQFVVSSSGPSSATRLDGFLIRGGSGRLITPTVSSPGGGMLIAGGGPALSNLGFVANMGFVLKGAGLRVTSNGAPALTNVTFVGNQYGLSVENGVETGPTLSSVTFLSNTGTDCAGLFNELSTVVMDHVTFTANVATDFGGGACNVKGGRMTMTDVTFTGNQAASGGGLFNDLKATATLSNVRFFTNSVSTDLPSSTGGAIESVNRSGLTISKAVFSGNSAGSGGAIHSGNGVLTVTGSTFTANRAQVDGGAIQVASGGTANLADVTLNGNSVITGNGGGIDDNSDGLTLTRVIFSGNAAVVSPGKGGGLRSTGVTAQTDVTYTLNEGRDGGGAYFSGGQHTLSRVSFFTNTGRSQGGGMNITGAIASLTDISFVGNVSNNNGGGGAFVRKSSITLNRTSFDQNVSLNDPGGGAEFDESQATIADSIFNRNRVQGGKEGGGIYIRRSAVNLTNTILSGNVAKGDGGGLDVNGTSAVTGVNLLFVGNSAGGQGGAAHVEASSLALVNATIAASSSPTGAVEIDTGGSAGIRNTIFWDNGASDIVADAGAQTCAPCQFGRPGSGVDPRFVRNPSPGDGDWTTPADNDYGDLQLRSISPAIDAGANGFVPPGVTLDLAGRPRFADFALVADTGTGAPPVVDLGAYEAQPALAAGLTGPASGAAGAVLAFTAVAGPSTAAIPITYTWQATGQMSVVRSGDLTDTFTFVWPEAGAQVVTVTVSNGGAPAIATLVVNIAPGVPGPIFISAAMNGFKGDW